MLTSHLQVSGLGINSCGSKGSVAGKSKGVRGIYPGTNKQFASGEMRFVLIQVGKVPFHLEKD